MGIFTFADMAAITVESAAALEEKFNDAMTSPEEWTNWQRSKRINEVILYLSKILKDCFTR